MDIPDTRYAITPDGVYLAYQAVGEGPIDLVYQVDLLFGGNIDIMWETFLGDYLREFASFSRVIVHDPRGTGLSSRDVAPPNIETRVADLEVILDAVQSDRPVLYGAVDGGASNMMFAASHPERVHSIVWWQPSPRSAWAPDFPWGDDEERLRRSAKLTADLWGSNGYGPAFLELEGSFLEFPAAFLADMGRLCRSMATPDVAVEFDRIWNETDVRAILPSVSAPTLLLTQVPTEIADYVASLMPDAEVRVLPDARAESDAATMKHIRQWLGIASPARDLDRMLAAVLFTDIVGSTERLTQQCDAEWRSVVGLHLERARTEIERHRGRFIDSAGDGVFATFDGPARAVRCAQAIVTSVEDLGIQIRAGVHVGEIVLDDEAVRGIAVHIGARVAALAGPSEVIVSQTVKDLVSGSGLAFEDAGEHELKGIPDRWRLYRVVEPTS
jgi:class 3 adenylate cyclase